MLKYLITYGCISLTGSVAYAQCERGDVFSNDERYFHPGGSSAVVVEDFDGDGTKDIAILSDASDIVGIRFNNGDGTMGVIERQYPIDRGSSEDLKPIDFDEDGDVDLVWVSQRGSAGLLVNDGNGFFGYGTSLSSGDDTLSCVVGDFNGDSHSDVALPSMVDKEISIYYGNGNGGYEPVVLASTGVVVPRESDSGDLNGDGLDDIVVYSGNPARLMVLRGAPDGLLVPSDDFLLSGNSLYAHIADIDSDGDSDIILSASEGAGTGSLQILANDGSGNFGLPIVYGLPFMANSLSTGDMDGDGNLDIVFATNTGSGISLLWFDSSGIPQEFGTYASASTTNGVVSTSDLDNNGDLDIVAAGPDTEYSVLLNQCTPREVCPADLNGDGELNFFDVAIFLSAYQKGCP